MPSKNTVKVYAPDSYYHIYNRGVEKRNIFLDDQDYRTFLSYFKLYLGTEPTPQHNISHRIHKDLTGQIQLLVYCLMSNHFHLLVHQNSERGITELMRCVTTGYTMYFNRKYARVGTLFQGRYKAVRVTTTEQLLHLSWYIHHNPDSLLDGWLAYRYSSIAYYAGQYTAAWLTKEAVLEHFTDFADYLNYLGNPNDDNSGSYKALLID